MKKVFFSLLALCIFAACHQNDSAKPADSGTDSSLKKRPPVFPSIGEDSALKMAEYYKSIPHDINTNIIQVMTLQTDALESIMTTGNIKFLTGAYMADNIYGKKDDPTVFIETNDGKGNLLFYDVHSLFVAKGNLPVICPPPGDCSIPMGDKK
jgi:hypothetical protein